MDVKVKKTIQEYFKEKPVERVWMFGSFSRGEEKPGSDVDLIVRFVPDARMGLSFCAMICDLEYLLHRPVDIVPKNVSSLLRQIVQNVITCRCMRELC